MLKDTKYEFPDEESSVDDCCVIDIYIDMFPPNYDSDSDSIIAEKDKGITIQTNRTLPYVPWHTPHTIVPDVRQLHKELVLRYRKYGRDHVNFINRKSVMGIGKILTLFHKSKKYCICPTEMDGTIRALLLIPVGQLIAPIFLCMPTHTKCRSIVISVSLP